MKQFSKFTLERGNETATSDLLACQSCRSDVQEFHSKAPRDPSRLNALSARPAFAKAPAGEPRGTSRLISTARIELTRSRARASKCFENFSDRLGSREVREVPTRTPTTAEAIHRLRRWPQIRASCYLPNLRHLWIAVCGAVFLQPHSLQSFFVNVATVRQATNSAASVMAAMIMASCQSTSPSQRVRDLVSHQCAKVGQRCHV